MHKFEIVTACVNHAHFLRETLPINKRKVDNVIVVTSPTDFETQKVCKENEVECVKTDLFYKYGAPFNRGLALNEAFCRLKYDDWVIHLDSDVILSRGYENIFTADNSNLKKDALYGAKRVEISNREEYLHFLKELSFFMEPKAIGEYVNLQEQLGCGFFQFFNVQSPTITSLKEEEILFPENIMKEFEKHGCENFTNVAKSKGDIYPSYYSCGGSDIHFRAMWNHFIEIKIPVLHLGRERDHLGKKIFQF